MDGPEELPPGWAWARLDEITEPVVSVSPAREFADRDSFAYVDLSAIERHAIKAPQRITPSDAPSRARQRIRKGDTLFSCVRVYLENVAQVAESLDGEIASTAFAVLRAKKGIEPEYIHWLVRRPAFILQMVAAQRGNSPPSVQEAEVRAALVPIAPAAEQRRIVAEIEVLSAELDEAEAALLRAGEGLAAYRASLLHAACTGSLTAGWRAANPRPAEDGAALLRRILAERRAAWERAELARLTAKGKPAPNGWKARYQEPQPPDTDGLPELPDGWVWANLEHLCAVIGGVTVDASREGTDLIEIPYLRVANVQRGYLDLDIVKTIRVPIQKANQLALAPNDVLLNEGGDRDKVGRGWVWIGQLPICIHQNHIFRARPFLPEFDGRFISHYLNEVGRPYFLDVAIQTTNLASISISKVALIGFRGGEVGTGSRG